MWGRGNFQAAVWGVRRGRRGGSGCRPGATTAGNTNGEVKGGGLSVWVRSGIGDTRIMWGRGGPQGAVCVCVGGGGGCMVERGGGALYA